MNSRFAITSFKRGRFLPGVAVFLVLFFAVGELSAQRGGGRTIVPNYSAIDQEEGRERMAQFRNQRLAGDYIYQFVLEHVPRRGESRVFQGQLWGSWNESGPISRLQIETEAGPIDLIFQNGPEPWAWRKRPGDLQFQKVEGEALFEPIIEGLQHSIFDLQMPFIYWDDFDYAGAARVNGRSAQRFFIYPPEDSPILRANVDRVRLALDDGYNALLRVDYYAADQLMSSFRIRSFKEVQNEWIVREIDLVDEVTRDRTKFRVDAATVRVVIPRTTFDPQSPAPPIHPPAGLFERL